jgi:hypothetical protein
MNENLTFSDGAAAYPPDPFTPALVTGSYKPASYFSNISFDPSAPALTPAAPYGATFKTFRGISPNGTWSLYATDDSGDDTGSIAGGWCLNIQTAASAGCANQLFQGSLMSGDTTQTGRLFREDVAGLCGTPKMCPSLDETTGSPFYDSYTITNNSAASACVTATVTGACAGNVFLVAYSTFNPTDLCANYLDDAGTTLPSLTSQTQTMSFDLAAGASVVLVVHEIDPGVGCASYGLLVEGDICGGCTSITCPANITQSNDPNQCGAVVTYPAPTPNGSGCGTVVCSPASGSFFPVGTTAVSCDASGTFANPDCTFTVTVVDTQPPTITCPPNQTAVTNQNVCAPPGTTPCQIVTFPAPTASDNCPGVTVACNPASGSCFPTGTTTVTCTATDASGNTATCSFTTTVFDVCLQDDSNPTTVLLFNSLTGDYRFCCNGTTFTGKGKVTRQGCIFTLEHNPVDRRVRGTADNAVFRGNASIQSPPGSTRCAITDRDTRNNSCACQ